ncbi:glutathione S-transferase N-terminal domain-containing protein [Candidatus Woesearchaeota archaeon]|nr:glutathione S-transferase N-terminal domain-containing protein [Candidatus Woesearchaeota archaeon]
MEIKIYTTPTCSWCVKLKEWLKKKKYAFQELDVTEEDEYSDEMLAKSGQLAVPVIDIDGKIIVGFHEQKIEEAIAKSK